MAPVVVASAIGAPVEVPAAPGLAVARTVLELAISLVQAVGIAMPLVGGTGDSTDRVRAEAAVAAPPVLALAGAAEASAAAVEEAEVVVDGADKRIGIEIGIPGAKNEISICECKSVPDGLHSRR